jgi:hypothetical protein
MDTIGKTTIAVVVVICAASASLQANAQMPSEMQGKWCDENPPLTTESTYLSHACEGQGVEMEVTPTGFNIMNTQCAAVHSAKTDAYPWGKRGPANAWGPRYHFRFRCTDKYGTSLVTEQDWQREKDYLL